MLKPFDVRTKLKNTLLALILLASACTTEDGTPRPETDNQAFPHCGPAPLDITWNITVDDQGTSSPADDTVVLTALEYAKVGDFHERALDWMECNIAEWHMEHDRSGQ